MDARYVKELAEGSRVDAKLALRAKELRTARTGDAYLMLELSDRTGSIPGVLFRPSRAAMDVPVGSVVAVEGSVTSYRGARRITVDLDGACRRVGCGRPHDAEPAYHRRTRRGVHQASRVRGRPGSEGTASRGLPRQGPLRAFLAVSRVAVVSPRVSGRVDGAHRCGCSDTAPPSRRATTESTGTFW